MGGLNSVNLLGNLGTDPEVRRTAQGAAVCRFRMATNEYRKTAEGWENHTEWHNIVTFGKSAETCSEFLRKGSKVFIEGALRTRAWRDLEGQPRHATEILARNIEFMTGKGADAVVGQRIDPVDTVEPRDLLPDENDTPQL